MREVMTRGLMAALPSVTVTLIATAGACTSESGGSPANLAARDFDGEDCAACGMIVREQTSPRGQVVHRDGARVYFCAIADMLAYLAAPSPHGEPAAIHVEALDPDVADPLALDTAKRPWVRAESASYVTGITRARVMGEPVLVYARRADADRIATRLGAQVKDWAALKRR